MTILYSNGCSFTENMNVDNTKRYPALVADALGYELISKAIPGSCNDRIIRCTIRDCIELLERNEKIIALVQLTYLHRTEYAGVPTEQTQYKYAINDLFESVKPDSVDIDAPVAAWLKHWLLTRNDYAEMTELLSKIVGLVGFFEKHNIEYRVYFGPRHFWKLDLKINDDIFYKYLKSYPNFLDFQKFCMLDLIGKDVHPDEDGMNTIAKYFIDELAQTSN